MCVQHDYHIEDCSDDEADGEPQQHAPQPPKPPAAQPGEERRRRGSELLRREPVQKKTRAAAQPKPIKVRAGRRSYVISQMDPRALTEREIQMPNAAWGPSYADGGSTATRVLHYAPAASDDGTDAYICEAEDCKYLFRAAEVAAAAEATA